MKMSAGDLVKAVKLAVSAAAKTPIGADSDLAALTVRGGRLSVRCVRHTHSVSASVALDDADGVSDGWGVAVHAKSLLGALSGVAVDSDIEAVLSENAKNIIVKVGGSSGRLIKYLPESMPTLEDPPTIEGPSIIAGQFMRPVKAVSIHGEKDSKSGVSAMSQTITCRNGYVIATDGKLLADAKLGCDVGDWAMGAETASAFARLDLPSDTIMSVRVEVGGWGAITWESGFFMFQPRQGVMETASAMLAASRHSDTQWVSLQGPASSRALKACSAVTGDDFCLIKAEARNNVLTLGSDGIKAGMVVEIEAATPVDGWSVNVDADLMRSAIQTLAMCSSSPDIMMSLIANGGALRLSNAEDSATVILAVVHKT